MREVFDSAGHKMFSALCRQLNLSRETKLDSRTAWKHKAG